MRVQTEEWRRFIPGVRMYKGKKTLFYNGEILWDEENNERLVYTEEQQQSWEVIIVLPGVEVIPEKAFQENWNIKVVIMSDTVIDIDDYAFDYCKNLSYVKLSKNIDYIGYHAFNWCESLVSIFIPESCRIIHEGAFSHCQKLIMFQVPRDITLVENVIQCTPFEKASPFPSDSLNGNELTNEDDYYANYHNGRTEELNEWIKNQHTDNQFSLHRACSASNPSAQVIFEIVVRQGIGAFKKPDSVGITASQYLSENPFTEITEQMIMRRYILEMMGEMV